MFVERIAEALAGTQTIAIVGDEARDDLYNSAISWGFRLASLKAADLPTFGEGHALWGSKSRAHWLLVIEDTQLLDQSLEDTLLDLAFDGCPGLPANTLIAVHFSTPCVLSEMLSDPMVPIAYLEKTRSEAISEIATRHGVPTVSINIAQQELSDLRGISLAA